jgi:hypothetical protein
MRRPPPSTTARGPSPKRVPAGRRLVHRPVGPRPRRGEPAGSQGSCPERRGRSPVGCPPGASGGEERDAADDPSGVEGHIDAGGAIPVSAQGGLTEPQVSASFPHLNVLTLWSGGGPLDGDAFTARADTRFRGSFPCVRHGFVLVIRLSANALRSDRYDGVRAGARWGPTSWKPPLTWTNRHARGRASTAEGGVQVPLPTPRAAPAGPSGPASSFWRCRGGSATAVPTWGLRGAQADEGDLAAHLALVVVVGVELVAEPSPELAAVCFCDLAGGDGDIVAVQLDRRLRLGLEVEPPARLPVAPAVRGGDDVVLAVSHEGERHDPDLAALAAHRREVEEAGTPEALEPEQPHDSVAARLTSTMSCRCTAQMVPDGRVRHVEVVPRPQPRPRSCDRGPFPAAALHEHGAPMSIDSVVRLLPGAPSW